MDLTVTENKELIREITKDLVLSDWIVQNPDMKELHRYLEGAIQELLDRDFNRLINILYRIDLREMDVAKALEHDNPDHISSTLATLVIERELQKIRSRKKYSSRGS